MADYKTLLEQEDKIKLYFVGIGGISMMGLAEFAMRMGYRISGSDIHPSKRLANLDKMGMSVHYQQIGANILYERPDMLIRTAAVGLDNPEIQMATVLKIPIITRAEFLGWISSRYKQTINVAGTHGKTTVTAMIATILLDTYLKPSVHIGAELNLFGHRTISYNQNREMFISEACEYSNSYLDLRSTIAAILNIDEDHLDFFTDIDDIVDSFVKFACQIDYTDDKPSDLILPFNGEHMDHFHTRLKEKCAKMQRPLPRITTFGFDQNADVYATDIEYFSDGHTTFKVHLNGNFYNELCQYHYQYHVDAAVDSKAYAKIGNSEISLSLQITGEHNVLNALAAIALALRSGIDLDLACHNLERFETAEGRLTFKGYFQGAKIYADYAHHPTSTKATLKAVQKLEHKHIWVVYQPLTYNRVRVFFDQYVEALKDCELVLFVELYTDREPTDHSISARTICDIINRLGGHAEFYMKDFPALKERLKLLASEGDIILFLGPEEVRGFADKLREFLPDHRPSTIEDKITF